MGGATSEFIFNLKKNMGRQKNSHALFRGHWYPCFAFLLMSPLGFKARVGSALFALLDK